WACPQVLLIQPRSSPTPGRQSTTRRRFLMAWIEKRKAPKAPQGATWRVCDRGADAHPFVVQSGFPRWADADEFLKKFEGRKVQGKTFDPARRRMTLADLYADFIVKPGLR